MHWFEKRWSSTGRARSLPYRAIARSKTVGFVRAKQCRRTVHEQRLFGDDESKAAGLIRHIRHFKIHITEPLFNDFFDGSFEGQIIEAALIIAGGYYSKQDLIDFEHFFGKIEIRVNAFRYGLAISRT